MKIGYTLSSEEFDPISLIRFARLAEDAGFDFLSISDHYHPWVDAQGHSPFVWSTLGGISQVTKKVNVFIAVVCPIIRIHPAIIAQAAATTQYMLNGRLILGVGTGENLNEHVVGKGWPHPQIRLEMLDEAMYIIRLLWKGGYKSYFGKYFDLDSARIYTLPKQSIPIVVSAFGPKATKLAGRIGDGFTTTSPNKKFVNLFDKSGGKGKTKLGQLSVCYDTNPKKAQEILEKEWPLSGLPKPLNTELRLPKHFENAARVVNPKDLIKKIPIGADAEAILSSIREYYDAGFDQVYIHNIGPNQEAFIKFANKKILPNTTF